MSSPTYLASSKQDNYQMRGKVGHMHNFHPVCSGIWRNKIGRVLKELTSDVWEFATFVSSLNLSFATFFRSFLAMDVSSLLTLIRPIKNILQVQLIPYNPDVLDESVLWTESKDLGDGYRTVRMVNNIRLNIDAFNGDKNHGGVYDGTTIVLWEWKKGDNQRWMILPYCKSLNISM